MWAYTVSAPSTITRLQPLAPTEGSLADGQVLLRVSVGGICGSDLPYFKGMVSPFGTPSAEGFAPATQAGGPLHEVLGEVVATRDPTLSVGAHVVGWATYMNAMSEYIVVNGMDVREFDSRVATSDAIMLQPLACVIYALDQIHGIEGKAATVIGQGPIGVLFSHVLKSRGAAHVTAVDRVDRRDLASTYGVDHSFWGTSDRWAASPAETTAPDVVVEAVGHQVSTLNDAVLRIREGGQIYYFGVPDDATYPMPMSTFMQKNAHLISGFTPLSARRDCLQRAEAHILNNPQIVAPYFGSRHTFADAELAFMRAINPAPGRLKVTLEV